MAFSPKQFNELWKKAHLASESIGFVKRLAHEVEDMWYIGDGYAINPKQKAVALKILQEGAQRLVANYEQLVAYTDSTVNALSLTIRQLRRPGQQKIYIVPGWEAREKVPLRTTCRFLGVRYHKEVEDNIYTAAQEFVPHTQFHTGDWRWLLYDERVLGLYVTGSHLYACTQGHRPADQQDIELMQKKFSDWGIESVLEG